MFERDHDEIHRLLAECSGGDWRQPAADLVHVLSEHIAREESDLFPAAHQLLRPDQWDAVDAVAESFPPAPKEPPASIHR